ncbi:MAG: RNA polymerase sigma-54 factor, partial [Bacteroidales bacterium]|nr:RNA polymerase sigma-54 factor [Bacteroidales bacterium]
MIKLLEIPNMELDQRIKEELEENPTLDEGTDNEPDEYSESVQGEEEKGFSIDEYSNTEDIPSYKLHISNVSHGEIKADIPFSAGTSFHEFLYNQLGMHSLDQRQKTIAQYIIGNIDEDGYLRRPVASIA